MLDKYLNPLKYEEIIEATGASTRRFISKDGKEVVEVRGIEITTTYKDENGTIQVSWKRVTDAD